MKTQIYTQEHLAAMAELAHLPIDSALYKIIAAIAEEICPSKEDFTCNVTKKGDFLQPCYRYNPSLFANKVLVSAPSFEDVSGHLQEGEICIILYRESRSLTIKGTRPGSMLHLIREALQKNESIEIPLTKIPVSWLARPEQLRYRIKLSIDRTPKIERFATKWIIS